MTSDPKEFASNLDQELASSSDLPSPCRNLMLGAGYGSLSDILAKTDFLCDMHINVLQLTVRSRNCLIEAGVTDLRSLLLLSKRRVLKFGNMGILSLLNVGQAIEKFTHSDRFEELLSTQVNRSSGQHRKPDSSNVLLAREIEQIAAYGWELPEKISVDMGAPVHILDLSVRGRSVMSTLEIGTIGDLLHAPPSQLLSQENCGAKTLAEIQRKLFAYLRAGSTSSEPTAQGFKAFIEHQLSRLDERSRSILRDRHGLWDDISETLQEIGDKFNVTRERIRQIEVKATRRLRQTTAIEIKQFVQSKLLAHFSNDEQSRIISEAELALVFADDCPEQEATVGIEFLIDLIGSEANLFGPFLSRTEEGVYLAGSHILNLYNASLEKLKEALAEKRSAMSLSELVRIAGAGFGNVDLFLNKILRVSPSFRIINDEFAVRSDWPLYSSKTTSALCRVALSFTGKPLHYEEIAAKIKQLNPELSSINPRTVHNELVRRTDIFTNVGEGTYALTEWGLKRAPFLKDALIEILSRSSYPLPYWYIEQQMRAISAYKQASIRMTLDLNPRIFKKYGTDQYLLRQE